MTTRGELLSKQDSRGDAVARGATIRGHIADERLCSRSPCAADKWDDGAGRRVLTLQYYKQRVRLE